MSGESEGSRFEQEPRRTNSEFINLWNKYQVEISQAKEPRDKEIPQMNLDSLMIRASEKELKDLSDYLASGSGVSYAGRRISTSEQAKEEVSKLQQESRDRMKNLGRGAATRAENAKSERQLRIEESGIRETVNIQRTSRAEMNKELDEIGKHSGLAHDLELERQLEEEFNEKEARRFPKGKE